MRLKILLSLAVLAALALPGQAATLTAGERDAARLYAALLAPARVNPANADWRELRRAYAASPAYDPALGSSAATKAVQAAFEKQDWAETARLAEKALAQNWMDVDAHGYASAAYARLGDGLPAAVHRAAIGAILRLLLASGDGAGPDSAFVVLSPAEEQVISGFLRLDLQGPAVPVRQGGHAYDKLTVTRPPDEEKHELWFNTDIMQARIAALAAGRAHLVADPDLTR